jgi:hypothetical protein
MKNIVPNNIEEMSGNSICLGTPKKHPGNTRETPGKHPGNTQETPGKHPGKVHLLMF